MSSEQAAATTTADYWVGPTIGEGAFGKVVHARHKATGRDVAIKVVTKQAIQKDKRLLDSVWNERRLLTCSTKLKSSNFVISLWASFHDSECLYLVMECATGGDLKHLIESGMTRRADWTPAIPSYALQLIGALEFIHTQSVVHGDLKPDNVLVTDSGLKLADFGAALDLLDTTTARSCNHGAMMGTADYASPQVVRGEEEVMVDCDLWSLGCILYAMWEGDSPFHDESDALAIRRITDYCAGAELRRSIDDDDWMMLIRDLLQPDSASRLGMKDYERREEGEIVVYASIRTRQCLRVRDSKQKPSFKAPAPPWRNEVQDCQFRDGATGWVAFLL